MAMTLTITLVSTCLAYEVRAISADAFAVHYTIALLNPHAVMADIIHEDSSTDVSDSSTDVSGGEDVAGIIVFVMK